MSVVRVRVKGDEFLVKINGSDMDCVSVDFPEHYTEDQCKEFTARFATNRTAQELMSDGMLDDSVKAHILVFYGLGYKTEQLLSMLLDMEDGEDGLRNLVV